MAKLSGFCMSALLIVICLWINVYRYPNAFDAAARGEGAARLDAAPRSLEQAVPQTPSVVVWASDSSDETDAETSDETPSEPTRLDVEPVEPAEPSTPSENAPNPFASQETILAENAESPLGATRDEKGAADFADVSSRSLSAQTNFEPATAKRVVSAQSIPEPSRGVPARLESAPRSDDGAPKGLASKGSAKTPSATKPQGGKYVSIPALETDALAPAAFDDDCRVIGATRAEDLIFELDE